MSAYKTMIKPKITESAAKAILWKLYGLKATKVKPLAAYFDKNFFVQVENKHNKPYLEEIFPNGYVLKVTNSLHSENGESFDAQCHMMLHLAEKGFHTPKPVKNIKGQYKELVHYQDYADLETMAVNGGEVRHMVMLLVFIEGKTFNDLDSWTEKHFYQCGQYAARMNNALLDFHHNAYHEIKSLWYMSSIPDITKYLDCVNNSAHRSLIMDIVSEFEKDIVPVLNKGNLPTAVIHGDMNADNIVMRPKCSENVHTKEGGYDVHAVIDFGDSQKNPVIFEVAIAITYLMIRGDVISAGGHLLAGYLSERQLTNEEIGLLRMLVAGRLVQSLVLGTHFAKDDPENEYLVSTINDGLWKVVTEFWNVPKDMLHDEWKKIIYSYSS